MKKAGIFLILLLSFVFLFAEEGQKSLFPEEVNAANLKALIKPEYADGTILYEENPYALNIMYCVFIEVMKNNLISFETYVSADSSLTLEECAKIANDWNNRHSFATVSFNQGEFYLQYYLPFSGGLHADNFNYTIEWVLASSFHFENYLKVLEDLKKKLKNILAFCDKKEHLKTSIMIFIFILE